MKNRLYHFFLYVNQVAILLQRYEFTDRCANFLWKKSPDYSVEGDDDVVRTNFQVVGYVLESLWGSRGYSEDDRD